MDPGESIFEIVTTTAGAVSIRNKVVNEIMHNPVGPWREANDLYISQSNLRERLRRHNGEKLVLFDVGLGAASNAIAACEARRSLGREGAALHIVSFENNLDLLAFALREARHFPHMRDYVEPLNCLLERRSWSDPDGMIRWELRPGDFLSLIEREPEMADVVFYDPYSPAVNGDMWTVAAFSRLRARCSDETLCLTYSVATKIRAAMLIAGFYTGQGAATGLKKETTQFATAMELLTSPFGRDWFGRWVRSHTRAPIGSSPEDQATLDRAVMEHPQMAPWLLEAETLALKAFPGRRLGTHAVRDVN
jgi:tRNA U34 5-methylaminomethyl-2-thiouridine-forming methyltransferase MnmC